MAKTKSAYAQKLLDPRWQRKRLEILERAKWACEACGDESSPLHVHHGFYRYGTEPWEYPDSSLHCLCEACHDCADHPSRVPKEGVTINPEDGTLTYKILNDKLPPTYLHQSEMFHVPGIHCDDDLWGKGVIAHAAESIGMGIAVEQYGASHFGNGGGPSIVLTHPKSLGETGAENLRRSWQKRHSGPDKANGLLVLEEDTKVSHLSFPPEANQFLQTRQFNITEIARWYNVPPRPADGTDQGNVNDP